MFKKIQCFIIISICVLMFWGTKTNVYAASAQLTGDGTVRAGDTITLSLKIMDSGKFGLEGNFEYDSSVVTLSNVTCSLNGWKLEENGNGFVLYDDALTNPISGTKTVMKLTFKVNSNVATGKEIKIFVKNLVTTDGNSESNLGTATYSVNVARPLSANANLSALAVENASLTPSFASGTTSYNIGEVSYETSKLNITYKTEDSNATVKVSGNSLSVGENTISVVVTAENGSKKTYTIKVMRAQDPNYQASSDATLSSISVNAGNLSPVFSKEVDAYIVYLPYEMQGTQFVASGNANDSKASGVKEGVIDTLAEGKNTTSIVVTAEDGTTKTYTVFAYVMPKFEGNIPQIGEVTDQPGTEEPETGETETDKSETEEPETEESETDKQADKNPAEEGSNSLSAEGIIIIVLVIIIIGLLGTVGVLLYKKANNP